jgi:hypothetical protein
MIKQLRKVFNETIDKNIDLNLVANYITNKNIIINKIEIYRQYKDIDFYIRLNEELVILFEDKIKTNAHDNQLERYNKIIKEKYPNDKIFFVYIKSDFVFAKEKIRLKNLNTK